MLGARVFEPRRHQADSPSIDLHGVAASKPNEVFMELLLAVHGFVPRITRIRITRRLLRSELMNLTRESEYALRGLVRLATYPPGCMVSHSEIAQAEELPAAFLAKIFQKLARHGVLEAERGRGSGYALRGSPAMTRIWKVFEAIEGSEALKRCLLWSRDS